MQPWVWTWIFQIANFLILVLLLKRFLYGPILKAIDRRQGKIAAHFEAAEEKEQEAIRKSETLDADRQKFDAERAGLLAEAKADAEKTRSDLTEKARAEIDELAARWREDLTREKDAFLDDLERRAGEQITAVARKALADLADVELERLMIGVLVRRLAEVSDDDRKQLAEALGKSGAPLVVATSWELPEKDRDAVAAAVGEHLVKDVEIRFETAPEITCGIELRAEGREIAWTVAGYIQGIREALAAVLDEKLAVKSEPDEKTGEPADA